MDVLIGLGQRSERIATPYGDRSSRSIRRAPLGGSDASSQSDQERGEVRLCGLDQDHLPAVVSVKAGDVDGQSPIESVLLEPWVPHANDAVR